MPQFVGGAIADLPLIERQYANRQAAGSMSAVGDARALLMNYRGRLSH